MKEQKFDENVQSIYSTLSNEQKEEYARKEESMNKGFFIIGIVLTIIVIVLAVGISVGLAVAGEASVIPLILVIFAAFLIVAIYMIVSSKKALNATDEIKIKTFIKRLEKQKQYNQQELEKQLQKNVYYRLSVENIKNVTILDSYTELSDKLHAFFNYKEIIQTRVYKFNVDYKDGNSRIITAAENSEEYNVLMPLVNKSADIQTPTIQEKSDIEKIREYKQLLDDGIITKEEFDAKKKELL